MVLGVCACVWGRGAFVKCVNRGFHTQCMSTGDVSAIGDIPSLKKGFKTVERGVYYSLEGARIQCYPICIGNKQTSFTPKKFSAMQLGIHNLYISGKLRICDMIKGNESDVGNIDFELQAKRGDKFLSFTLFLDLKNCSYLCNRMLD